MRSGLPPEGGSETDSRPLVSGKVDYIQKGVSFRGCDTVVDHNLDYPRWQEGAEGQKEAACVSLVYRESDVNLNSSQQP